MNDRETEAFLDTYKQLETAAERLVGSDSRSSVIMRLGRHRDFQKYQDELDFCRQVRNILTHEAKIEGHYGVFPSAQLQAFLQKMLRFVEDPPTVEEEMTPVNRLLLANLQDPVLPLMAQMHQRGFSYVPLLQNKKVAGIFSLDTVFQWTLDRQEAFSDATTLTALSEYLPLNRHMGQGFVFVPPAMLLSDARDLFDKAYEQNHQIKLLLVTKNGKEDGPLLGIISPYDLLDRDSLL